VAKLTEYLGQVGDRVRLASRVTALTGGTKTVDSVVVTNGGSGYTTAPAVNFSSGAAAATAIISGGRVIGVTVTSGGTGYASTPTVSFSGGGGSGAAATAQMLALDLDAIPTTALTVPLLVIFVLAAAVEFYQLVAGTDAESSPTVIRPDDYAGGTNEKVWKRLAPAL
jgi:hypothetical protein